MTSNNSSCFGLVLGLSVVFVLSGCTGASPTKSNNNPAVTSNINTPANQAVVSTGSNLEAPGTAQPGPPAAGGAPPPLSPGAVRPSTQSNAKPMPTVKMPEPEIGSGGNDFSLFAEVRSKIMSDQSLGEGVIIDVKQGTVILTGSVSNEANRSKAARLAQSVKGVKAVKNNLRIGN